MSNGQSAVNGPVLSASQAFESVDFYVDLDGTLLRTDLFHESVWRFIKRSPWKIFWLASIFILRGRAAAKTLLARKVSISPETLPYEKELIADLRRRKAAGQRLVLITAAHWRHARRVGRHLALFGATYGSSARENLKGKRKLARIRALCAGQPFGYAGDSASDRPIWRAAQQVILVNAPRRDVAEAKAAGRVQLVITSRPPAWRAVIREMRLHQWAKNALLFVPLLTSHTYGEGPRALLALAAFLVFGLAASGHYFLNDLLDLDADRAHARKSNRPLASGNLSLGMGLAGALVLPLFAFALSVAILPWYFTATLGAYFILTNLYSFYLKRVSTADIVALAMLYTVRVVAGAIAISVVISSWLLAFSMFVFISLAYLKRYIELAARTEAGIRGRGYSGTDAETMFSLGIANSTAAIVVLAFYISSAEVKILYNEPEILWGLCLLMLYWTNRIWIGARRGKIHDDPIVFAIRDRVSLAVGLLSLAVVLAARILP